MLIARAPVRISLGGGGTDLPAYYERFGGLVVSTTIDKFVYVQVQPNGFHSAQIASADYRTFYRHHAGGPMNWDGGAFPSPRSAPRVWDRAGSDRLSRFGSSAGDRVGVVERPYCCAGPGDIHLSTPADVATRYR